jgi:bifunctional UDP-N-acetylglucosamine pyrophosphorylase/glucosamine-1-phosphate N-acetyltransferase
MKKGLKGSQKALSNVACIVLAAGEGTRMKSEVPKVLHTIYGKSLIQYVLDTLKIIGINKIVTVIGYKSDDVAKSIDKKSEIVVQEQRLGTADAVKQGLKKLSGFKGKILILCADAPLIVDETLKALINVSRKSNADCSILTATIKNPTGYGRILRNDEGKIVKIIEEKDASLYEKVIEEINTGVYCFKSDSLFNNIEKIKRNKIKKEYYLTDIVEIFSSKGLSVNSHETLDIEEIIGINSRFELIQAHKIMRKRIIKRIIEGGVTIVDPDTVYIDENVEVGMDTVIQPFVRIEKDVKIGKRCILGPFLRIRPGSVIENNVRLGNFVEVVRSTIKSNSKANHLAYIGDSHLGKAVNVGAGAVTANYNGKKKNATIIGDNAFIGSGSILVAPVEIGQGAITGANSLVTKGKVRSGAVVVGVPAKEIKKKDESKKIKKAGV